MGNADPELVPPCGATTDRQMRERWIRAKYIQKAFVAPPADAQTVCVCACVCVWSVYGMRFACLGRV